MPPKAQTLDKKEEQRKQQIKIPEPKKPQIKKEKEEEPKELPPPRSPPKSPKSPKNSQPDEDVNDQASKKKRQAEMFKKYLDQTGIAMAFQVIFAQILDKKIGEQKLFSYTALRLRQIGQDLQKIKISKKT